MRFHGGGERDFHGDFLPDNKAPAGLNKNPAGADVINRCFENTFPGLAMRRRQDLGELFPAVTPFFNVFFLPVSNKIIAHSKNQFGAVWKLYSAYVEKVEKVRLIYLIQAIKITAT